MSPHGEQGSAIVVAMLLMTLFLLLGGAFLTTSLGDGLIAANQVASTRAFHLAEAGLEHARATLDAAKIDSALEGDGWLYVDEPLGTGSYSVRVTNNLAPTFPLAGVAADSGGASSDTDGYVVLTSTGAFRRASRTLRIVVRQDRRPWAGWGVFGADFVSAQGPGVFDSTVGTNHDVILRSDVLGDAIAGGIVRNPERVAGSIVEGAPRIRFPATLCPSGPYGPAPSGPGVTFNPISGDLTIDSATDVVLDAGSYFFHKVTKRGAGKLVVRSGDVVELYVKSDIVLEDAVFDTQSGSPGDVLLLGCSENTGISAAAPEWRIAPDHTTYLTVYAPTHRLRLYGDGDKVGVFVGKSLYKVGRGNIVHSSDGGSGSGGGGHEVIRGTWSSF